MRLQNFAVNIVEAQFINSLADQDGNETTLSKVLAASTFLGPAPGPLAHSLLDLNASQWSAGAA